MNAMRRKYVEMGFVVTPSGHLLVVAKKDIQPNWTLDLLVLTKTNARWVPIGVI